MWTERSAFMKKASDSSLERRPSKRWNGALRTSSTLTERVRPRWRSRAIATRSHDSAGPLVPVRPRRQHVSGRTPRESCQPYWKARHGSSRPRAGRRRSGNPRQECAASSRIGRSALFHARVGRLLDREARPFAGVAARSRRGGRLVVRSLSLGSSRPRGKRGLCPPGGRLSILAEAAVGPKLLRRTANEAALVAERTLAGGLAIAWAGGRISDFRAS